MPADLDLHQFLHNIRVHHNYNVGEQWLSGRVLDLILRGCGFEPHRCHCVVSLSKTHLSLLSTGLTQEDLS